MIPVHPLIRSSRRWFLVAALAAAMAAVAWVHWWQYQRSSRAAADALAFKNVEIKFTQPPFRGITAQIGAHKYYLSDHPDIVANPDSIKLDETISLELQPTAASAGCSPSNIAKFYVALDAPAFTADRVGDASRSLEALVAASCDLSQQSPVTPAPWRWNLLATRAGHHLMTLTIEAFDKQGEVVDSRSADIAVTVLAQPESLSTTIGVLGGVVALISGMIGLWQQFRDRPENHSAAPR